ncbi:MAG: hypothetical protein QS748_04020 [Candidatus Endonucleobacter bathymodioli]|uniref:Uncharacterized protein n=1 Tax=Candidatus Endonucleibacter bathymodioli TaxID=539814 RepID=A0AA90SCQ6_9GAMM|nr:hypothetical protein [Candidatus Endonucleobacter bathymodioli]
MRDTSNLVCCFFASIVVMITSTVATNVESCVDKCLQGELGRMPFFPCKQKEPSEKNIHLKIIMTSKTECYSLNDLGIEYENITFHTGLAYDQYHSKIVPQNKSTIIVSKNNQKETTYLIFDYEQVDYEKKGYPIDASIFMPHPADTETLSHLSRLTDALLKRKEPLNQNDSSKTTDNVNIEITIDRHREKDMTNIKCSGTSVTFLNKFSLFYKNIGISLSIRQIEDYAGKYTANYTFPNESDIFRKEHNNILIKTQETDIHFGTTIITDKKEITNHRYYFYEDTQHSEQQEILFVTFLNNKAVLYAQPLPKVTETGILTYDKRVISTSPELELFLAYHSFSSRGAPHKMMFVYMSDKDTVSIFYRPDTPEHYSVSPKNDCDASWENAIKSLWESNITDKLSVILDAETHSQQEDTVNAKLTKKHPNTIKDVNPNELSSQEMISKNMHNLVKIGKSRPDFPDSSSKKNPASIQFPPTISLSNHETNNNTNNTTLPQFQKHPLVPTKIKSTPTGTHLNSNSIICQYDSDQQRSYQQIQFKKHATNLYDKTSNHACTISTQQYHVKKLNIGNNKKTLKFNKYKGRVGKVYTIEQRLHNILNKNTKLTDANTKLADDNTKLTSQLHNLEQDNNKKSETITNFTNTSDKLNAILYLHLQLQAKIREEQSKETSALYSALEKTYKQLIEVTKERDTCHDCYRIIENKLNSLGKSSHSSLHNPITDLSKSSQDQKKPMLFYQESQPEPKWVVIKTPQPNS